MEWDSHARKAPLRPDGPVCGPPRSSYNASHADARGIGALARLKDRLSPSRTGATAWLIAVWYVGLSCAALLGWAAMEESDTYQAAAALLSAAVVLMLALASYSLRARSGDWNRHSVVAAVGPLVIAIMLFEYYVYNRRIEDTVSTHLIPSEQVELADVDWSAMSARGHLSGVIRNHSSVLLRSVSVDLSVFPRRRTTRPVRAVVTVDVPPGAERPFDTQTDAPPSGMRRLHCFDTHMISRAAVRPPAATVCSYEVAQTHGDPGF